MLQTTRIIPIARLKELHDEVFGVRASIVGDDSVTNKMSNIMRRFVAESTRDCGSV